MGQGNGIRSRVLRRWFGAGLSVVLAGAGLTAALVVATVAPAGAVTVSTEAAFRTNFGSDSGTIDLAADITCVEGTFTRASSQALTINGNGHTISAGVCTRLLLQSSSGSLTFNNVTLTGANLATSDPGPGGNASGGALLSSGNVTFANSAITGNAVSATGTNAEAEGGGVYVTNSGSVLTLVNTTVSNNTASCSSCPAGRRAVGGVSTGSSSSIVLRNSTVTGNTAACAGTNCQAFGGVSSDNSLTLVYSTVAGNSGATAANVGVVPGDGATFDSFASVVASPTGGPTARVWRRPTRTTGRAIPVADSPSTREPTPNWALSPATADPPRR